MDDIESKIHWLANQYAEASNQAACHLEIANEKLAESRKLHRRLEYWLARQKEKHSGRKMKIKPARKRKEPTK